MTVNFTYPTIQKKSLMITKNPSSLSQEGTSIGQHIDKIEKVIQNQQCFIESLLESLKLIHQGNPTFAHEIKVLSQNYAKSLKRLPRSAENNEFDQTFNKTRKDVTELQARVLNQEITEKDIEIKEEVVILQILSEIEALQNKVQKLENAKPQALASSNTLKLQEKIQKSKTKMNVKLDNMNKQITTLKEVIDSLVARYGQQSEEIIRIDALLQSCSVQISTIEADVSSVNPEQYQLAIKKLKERIDAINMAIASIQEVHPTVQDIIDLSAKVERVQKQICEFPEIQTKIETQRKDLELLKTAVKRGAPLDATGSEESFMPISSDSIKMLLENEERNKNDISTQKLAIEEIKFSLQHFANKSSVDTSISRLGESLAQLKSNTDQEMSILRRSLEENNQLKSDVETIQQSVSLLKSELDSTNSSLENLSKLVQDNHSSLTAQIQSNHSQLNKRIGEHEVQSTQQQLELRTHSNNQFRELQEKLAKIKQEIRDEHSKNLQFIQTSINNQHKDLKDTMTSTFQEHKRELNEVLNETNERTKKQLEAIQVSTNIKLQDQNSMTMNKLRSFQASVNKKLEDENKSTQDKIEENQNVLLARLQEHKDNLEQRMKDYQSFNEKIIQENKEIANETISKFEQNTNTKLQEQHNLIKEQIDRSIDNIKTETENRVKQVQDEIQNEKSNTEKILNEHKNQLTSQLEQSLQGMNSSIEKVQTNIDELKNSVQTELSENSKKTDQSLKEIESRTTSVNNETRLLLEKRINDSVYELNRKMERTEESVDKQLKSTITKVDQIVYDSTKETLSSLNGRINETKSMLNKEISRQQSYLNAINQDIDDLWPLHREVNRLKLSVRCMGAKIQDNNDENYPLSRHTPSAPIQKPEEDEQNEDVIEEEEEEAETVEREVTLGTNTRNVDHLAKEVKSLHQRLRKVEQSVQIKSDGNDDELAIEVHLENNNQEEEEDHSRHEKDFAPISEELQKEFNKIWYQIRCLKHEVKKLKESQKEM